MTRRFFRCLGLAVAAVALWPPGLAVAAGQAPGVQAGAGRVPGGVPRTPWGDPDLQGTWTSEPEYGVPLERAAEFGTRPFLTDEEYAARLAQVRQRDAGYLKEVDVFNARGVGAPVPHWREENTTSRRTSLVVDPPDGRIPPETPQGRLRASQVPRGSSLAGDGVFDSVEDFSLHQRCLVQGGGFPATMFPAVYNANVHIVQTPGYVAIVYELIHDTRVIPLDNRPPLSPAIGLWLGDARGRWEGDTLVVETTNFTDKTNYRGSGRTLRLIERFTRTDRDTVAYEVTAVDPATWTAPWTTALGLKARPSFGLFEYACHEGNRGIYYILSTTRGAEEAKK